MPPKNAPSLRPTAAAALLSLAALFCVTVELAFARETQYFYNSVTGEVLYCARCSICNFSLLFSNPIFSRISRCVVFCDRMIARRIFSLRVSRA